MKLEKFVSYGYWALAVALLFVLTSASFGGELNLKDLEAQLQTVRAQGETAAADFERGRVMAQSAPAIMRDAQQRLKELQAQEQALIDKIEAARKKGQEKKSEQKK